MNAVLQAAVFDEGWIRLLEMLGACVLGAVSAIAVFRARLSTIGTQVAATPSAITAAREQMEKALTKEIADVRALITQRESAEVAETRGAETRLNLQLTSIRNEMNERHRENRRDALVSKRQQLVLLEILVDTLPAKSKKQIEAAMRILRVELDGETQTEAAA